jgi:hypothetical protein
MGCACYKSEADVKTVKIKTNREVSANSQQEKREIGVEVEIINREINNPSTNNRRANCIYYFTYFNNL